MKKGILTGIVLAVLSGPLLHNEAAFAAESYQTTNAALIKEISQKKVVERVAKWMSTDSYIGRGGDYHEGEYRNFQYQNQTYRYLSKDIDTKSELMKYLTKSLTSERAENYIKEKGIIIHKRKLAQPEADGGSILQWDQASAAFDKTVGKERIYTLTVPVGDTGEYSTYKVHFKYVKNQGWKISKEPYQQVNLDIPFNINPSFIFFKYLLVDSTVSKGELLNENIFDVDSFKKGIKNIEVRTINESGRTDKRVEFLVTFDVQLIKNYKGSLKNGSNQLYFLVENTGEMEYKIVSIGNTSHFKE